MPRAQSTLIASLLAALVLSSIASSAASAHEFKVEGKAVTESAFHIHGSLLLKDGLKLVLKVTGIAETVSCSHLLILALLNKAGQFTATLSSSGCEMTKPSKCPVTIKETLAAGALVSKSAGKWETEPSAQFKATEAEEKLTAMTITECGALNGTFNLKGKQTCEFPGTPGTEAEKHAAICKTKGSELIFGSEAATFETLEIGTLEILTAEGKPTKQKWSMN